MLSRWESVLDRLERDPDAVRRRARLVAKPVARAVPRQRDGLDWSDAKLQLIDLQYADIRPEKGPTTGWSPVVASSDC